MSDPTPGYDPQNPQTRRYGQPPAQPPAAAPGQPPALPPTHDPRADFPEPQRTVSPADPRLTVEAGRFWAGAAATALVAALIGLIGVIVFERIFSTGSQQAAWAIDGAILAILAAGLLHLLILSTPRPRAFFGWIMALVIVVIAVLPFAWTSDVTAAALSGLINLLIGIAVWSLLAGVAGRTIVRRPAV
jgi:hypothetical protein